MGTENTESEYANYMYMSKLVGRTVLADDGSSFGSFAGIRVIKGHLDVLVETRDGRLVLIPLESVRLYSRWYKKPLISQEQAATALPEPPTGNASADRDDYFEEPDSPEDDLEGE